MSLNFYELYNKILSEAPVPPPVGKPGMPPPGSPTSAVPPQLNQPGQVPNPNDPTAADGTPGQNPLDPTMGAGGGMDGGIGGGAMGGGGAGGMDPSMGGGGQPGQQGQPLPQYRLKTEKGLFDTWSNWLKKSHGGQKQSQEPQMNKQLQNKKQNPQSLVS